MDQERQRGLVGPLKVLKDIQLRTGLSCAPQFVGNALEEMAAFLRRRQIRWFRNIRKNSPKAWNDLGKFRRIVPYPPTEIIEARRLSEAAFNDLHEGEKGKRFVSFVAVPDQVSEANPRCILRHLHRQPGFTHPGSARQHDD